MYNNKYFKYKNKYLYLKNLIGGSASGGGGGGGELARAGLAPAGGGGGGGGGGGEEANIIPDELLNKTITLSIKDIVKYEIKGFDAIRKSDKYPQYYFLNVTANEDLTYSLKIIEKTSLITTKPAYQKELTDEIKSRNELRKHERLPEFSINYNMSSYHYIYFNILEDFTPEEDNYIIENYILKYSYPSCMNVNYDLSPDEKRRIIDNEFNFMSEKLKEFNPNIILVQIPNIIYSLYNIYIQFNLKIEEDIDISSLNIRNQDYKSYCDLLLQSYNRKYIVNINNRLIALLFETVKTHASMNNEYWLEILNKIIDKIYSFLPVKDRIICNGNIISLLLPITQYGVDIRFNQERNKKILETALINELIVRENNILFLYRGAEYFGETTTRHGCNIGSQSISFNTLLLNAILYDVDACTFHYYKKNFHKFYYIIRKHFYNDESMESKIFWIPPIHPVLLPNLGGELFHARTKIPSDYLKQPMTIRGIADDRIPGYMISDLSCAQLLEEYNRIIRIIRFELVAKEFNKYLKF